MALTVQWILQQYFDGFAARRPLSDDMRYAAVRLRDCRTSALGGHVISCPYGHVERIAYNSCRHRSCPQCSQLAWEAWLHGWRARLLDCPHFHVVFTVPHDLLALWRYNKRRFASALFAAASRALLELLGEEKYLGARPGLLAALHTWSQTLAAQTATQYPEYGKAGCGGCALSVSPFARSRIASLCNGAFASGSGDRGRRNPQAIEDSTLDGRTRCGRVYFDRHADSRRTSSAAAC